MFTKSIATVCVALMASVAIAAEKAPATQGSASASNQSVMEIRRVMAQAADRALHKDAVKQVLEMVNKVDRDRIEKGLVKGDDAAYQAISDKVLKTWKDKYGKDFNAEGHVDTLGDLNVIVTGEGKDAKAHINLPAEPGENAYELHLMREKNGFWRIELPDTLDGKTFSQKLMAAVQNVEDTKDKLPGAMRKGYQRVTTQLLQEMAFPSSETK